MDDRIIEFVRGMRAAGVRVSMAESADAMRAVEVLGVGNRELFRQSLRATLVKESDDVAVFEELFPLYFSAGGPPMQNAMEDLSEDEQEMLKAALQALSTPAVAHGLADQRRGADERRAGATGRTSGRPVGQ